MDPNNNQPINTNPFAQPAQQPVAAPAQPVQQPTPTPTPTPAVPTVTPETMPQAPKNRSKKGTILLIILIILILGMGFYVFFVKNQLNTAQKTSTENTDTVVPTATIAPIVTPASVDEINLASPDADLKDIEADLQGL